MEKIEKIEVPNADPAKKYYPYERNNETLSRYMALPGTPGMEHRLGGLEKEDITGNVNYTPENHEKMVMLRAEKIKRIGKFGPEPVINGEEQGEMLIVSWGSTYGTIRNTVEYIRKQGDKISWCHLRWINPLPLVLGRVIHNFKHVFVPEINLGQLVKVIRSEYLVDAIAYNKVRGLPFNTNDMIEAIYKNLKDKR
jgi:2-oxoglutarate ferredoxin oxidoreductase subunit alpha